MTEKCQCGRELKYTPVPGAIIEVLPCACGRNGYIQVGHSKPVISPVGFDSFSQIHRQIESIKSDDELSDYDKDSIISAGILTINQKRYLTKEADRKALE